MKDALVALAVAAVVGFFAYKLGYEHAQSFYVARIEQTERAITDALEGSSHALRELSQIIGLDDENDLVLLREIANAATDSGDVCRIELDRLRPLDAITSGR